jgi:seryl-tRNA synthetase
LINISKKMLELQRIRQDKDQLITSLKKRGVDFSDKIERIISLDESRRITQGQMDQAKGELNAISKEIGSLFQAGKQVEANALKLKTIELKNDVEKYKALLEEVEIELQDLLYTIPNVPHKLVPAGVSENDNEVVDQEGEIPKLYENAVPHWDLCSRYKLIDFELGVKITGAGFPLYTGKGARLQRALINFFLVEATKAGYTEMMPPLMVNEASGIGTGQLPDKEGQMYHAQIDDLYLIPTAEVPLTNIYRDSILRKDELPQKITGHTPCFRREAGSYGKDVRGLNRLHQFEKVEIVQIVDPQGSYEVLDTMVEHVKGLLRKLELPFRTLRLCGGDLGFTSAMTYDMEVYSTAQERWLEVSSISNFETFQANRLKCRYKDENGKNQFVHTLNGSALALPRIMAALLENNQSENGIRIPKALVPYTGFEIIE